MPKITLMQHHPWQGKLQPTPRLEPLVALSSRGSTVNEGMHSLLSVGETGPPNATAKNPKTIDAPDSLKNPTFKIDMSGSTTHAMIRSPRISDSGGHLYRLVCMCLGTSPGREKPPTQRKHEPVQRSNRQRCRLRLHQCTRVLRKVLPVLRPCSRSSSKILNRILRAPAALGDFAKQPATLDSNARSNRPMPPVLTATAQGPVPKGRRNEPVDRLGVLRVRTKSIWVLTSPLR